MIDTEPRKTLDRRFQAVRRAGRPSPQLFAATIFAQAALAGLLVAQPSGPAPLTVSGSLVDERGRGTAGVGIALRRYPTTYEQRAQHLAGPELLPDPVDITRSNSNGSFSLSAPMAGPWRLEIRPQAPPGGPRAVIAPLYYELPVLANPIALEPIELPAQHRLAIEVVDAGGEPVTGALVVAEPTVKRSELHTHSAAHEQPAKLYPVFDRATALTDSKGLARFQMPTERANVAVWAAPFGLGFREAVGGRAVFRLEHEAGVAFRVRSPNGKAEPLVLVSARGQVEVPMALTDAAGKANVNVATNQEITFAFEAPDGALADIVIQTNAAEVGRNESPVMDVSLASSISLHGRIADAESNHGLPGAAVWVSSDPGRGTVADAWGGFDLIVPARADHLDLATAAIGYLSTNTLVTTDQLQTNSSLSIMLRRAAPLHGSVINDLGQPVQAASILAEPNHDARFLSLPAHQVSRVTSAHDGSFWIPHALYGSPYRLIVRAPAYASSLYTLTPTRAGEWAEPVRIVLSKGRESKGVVVDMEGTPLAGTEVRLLWPQKRTRLSGVSILERNVNSTISNARGEFVFANVAPGSYRIGLSHPQYMSPNGRTVNIPPGDGQVDLGAFPLEPGVNIRGVVLDRSRRPVAGANVVGRQPSEGRTAHTRTATTNGEGRFLLAGLLPDSATVTVAARGYAPSVLEDVRPAAADPIRVELTEGASLVGRVFEPGGKVAVGAEVRLSLSATQPGGPVSSFPAEHLSHTVTTGADGRFRFVNLVPATWFGEVSAHPGRALIERLNLAGGELREIQVQLEPESQLTLHVVNHLNNPVAGARIQVSFERFTQPPSFGRSDATGRAHLSTGTGVATVDVSHSDWLPRTVHVALEPGPNDVHIQLDPGFGISGVVSSAHQVPIPGAVVEAFELNAVQDVHVLSRELQLAFRSALPPAQAVSDGTGAFRLTGLARGHYRLAVRLPGSSEVSSIEDVHLTDQSVYGVEIVLYAGEPPSGDEPARVP